MFRLTGGKKHTEGNMMCTVVPFLHQQHQDARFNDTPKQLQAGGSWFTVNKQVSKKASLLCGDNAESLCEKG